MPLFQSETLEMENHFSPKILFMIMLPVITDYYLFLTEVVQHWVSRGQTIQPIRAGWNWDGYVISDANAPHILKFNVHGISFMLIAA